MSKTASNTASKTSLFIGRQLNGSVRSGAVRRGVVCIKKRAQMAAHAYKNRGIGKICQNAANEKPHNQVDRSCGFLRSPGVVSCCRRDCCLGEVVAVRMA
jgi:hypothetical protein